MKAVVFAGPTISREHLLSQADVVCLPPVAQGDVYRAARMQPRVIGIIDGYFEGVPAVWHKEILWAMQQGIHVYGSASMGALRASELHDYGMVGIGRVFDAYRRGAYEDDDEVAVLHGPAETNYVALSEALVNIRATLERAQSENIISAELHRGLLDVGKRLFYQERNWDALLDHPLPSGKANAECKALRGWLPEGKVDVKREDAGAMLDAIADLLSGDPEPKQVDFGFEWTDMWDSVAAIHDYDGLAVGRPDLQPAHKLLLEELRLLVEPFSHASEAALLRRLALRADEQPGSTTDRTELDHEVKRVRARLGLYSQRDIGRWLAENGAELERLEHLLLQEARLEVLRDKTRRSLGSELVDHLQISGDYPELAARARGKQRLLATLGLQDPEIGCIGPAPPQLVAWYFGARLGTEIPERIDDFWKKLGYESKEDFYRTVLREYIYLNGEHQAGGEGPQDRKV